MQDRRVSIDTTLPKSERQDSNLRDVRYPKPVKSQHFLVQMICWPETLHTRHFRPAILSIASWNEHCGTDLFAGTFAGSVPEPACISQLCLVLNPAEKPEKPHSRSVRGGFAKRVRAMANFRRYRSTSRKAGASGISKAPQNGTTRTHTSALWRSFVIFSFCAE